MLRQGVIDSPPKTPVIMGYECAGTIEALGENTEGFSVSINYIYALRKLYHSLICINKIAPNRLGMEDLLINNIIDKEKNYWQHFIMILLTETNLSIQNIREEYDIIYVKWNLFFCILTPIDIIIYKYTQMIFLIN